MIKKISFFLQILLLCTLLLLLNDGFVPYDRLQASLNEPTQDTPLLMIPDDLTVSSGDTITVPVEFKTNGATVTGMAFSIDFDQECLSFDGADEDGNRIPDAVTFNLTAQHLPSVTYQESDEDGELDFVIADFRPPLAPLPEESTLVEIAFLAICQPEQDSSMIAEVKFSTVPEASFGDADGLDVIGSIQDGAVRVLSAPPMEDVTATVIPMETPTVTVSTTAIPTVTQTSTVTPAALDDPAPQTSTPIPTATTAPSFVLPIAAPIPGVNIAVDESVDTIFSPGSRLQIVILLENVMIQGSDISEDINSVGMLVAIFENLLFINSPYAWFEIPAAVSGASNPQQERTPCGETSPQCGLNLSELSAEEQATILAEGIPMDLQVSEDLETGDQVSMKVFFADENFQPIPSDDSTQFEVDLFITLGVLLEDQALDVIVLPLQPTPASTPTSIPTMTPTATPMPSNTPTATLIPTNTLTATPMSTNTPTATLMSTNMPTATLVPTNTPTSSTWHLFLPWVD